MIAQRTALPPALALLITSATAPVLAQQPDTVMPVLQNAREMSMALDAAYPPVLMKRGIGASVHMRIFVTDAGSPDSVTLAASTGLLSFDRAADRVARQARFSPATVADASVGAWIDLNLEFVGSRDDYGTPAATLPVENRAHLRKALHPLYPADLRKSQIGTRVAFWILVDRAGTVTDHEIVEPSCFESANEAAVTVLRNVPFSPAADDNPRGRWSHVTVGFSQDSVGLTLFGDVTPRDTTLPDVRPPGERHGETRAPILRNRTSVQNALVRSYPTRLREMGIGGTAVVHFYVETDGRVSYRSVSTGSGHCELDIAALDVARTMHFNPALSDGERVPVWVEIPINFNSVSPGDRPSP